MDISTLAVLLFAGRVVSIIFIGVVLSRQVRLFKLQVQEDLVWFRRALFILALTILFWNFLELVIDFLTIVKPDIRAVSRVGFIGTVYSGSNVLVADLSAILIWVMYRMAARVLIHSDQTLVEATKEDDSTVANTPLGVK